jgi:hypothetical protein
VPVSDMYPWHARVKLPSPDAPLELWALDVAQRRISRLSGSVLLNAAAKSAAITHP